MDKNAIKKYATWARRELIARVSQKAEQYGVTEKKPGDVRAESVNGYLLSQVEQVQRRALILRVQQSGYRHVMEEVAYTWFNRFCALRFMEANHYLPTHIRVFTDEEGAFKPQIITEAIHLEMDGLDMDVVYRFKHENKTEELYKYLLITQCNALNAILPQMFQRIADYTELLLPDNLLREGSVIEQMIALIPEEDWLDQVQIIGWLYQYYNAEPKDQVFANLKKNIKISKADIPAATQLFTSDWIVRYMVENSLGRLWINHLESSFGYTYESNTPLRTNTGDRVVDVMKSNWKYYIEEADQSEDVEFQLENVLSACRGLTPESIKCMDPCMGSGHILVYMFDVLVQIYESFGYSTREAVQSIIENNLYGLDIDDRAAQLAYFAVMMKARQYDKRFFSRGAQPHVCTIQESGHMPGEGWRYFGEQEGIARRVYDAFVDAKEYGSILEPNVTLEDLDALERKMLQKLDEADLAATANAITACNAMWPLVRQARMLVQKYDVVVTNPPYMGSSGMGALLGEYLKKNYPSSKNDMFSVFIEKCGQMLRPLGYQSMITMESWMFLSSFEKLREKLISEKTIINLIHMPYLGKGGTSLGINFGTATFIMQNLSLSEYNAQYVYIRYFETDDDGVPFEFPVHNHRYCTNRLSNFQEIEGTPIVYSSNDKLLPILQGKSHLYDLVDITGSQHKTANNDKYLRNIWEVDATVVGEKWITYSKGGAYRKWWGNIDLVVDWSYDAQKFYQSNPTSNCIKEEYRFRSGLTWTATTNYAFSLRVLPPTGIFDIKGPAMFPYHSEDTLFILGLMNSSAIYYVLKMFKEGSDYQNIEVKRVPVAHYDNLTKKSVNELVDINITCSRADWDSFETSWDFQTHPLIAARGNYEEAQPLLYADDFAEGVVVTEWSKTNTPIAQAYDAWEREADRRFTTLKANEEKLNRIFIDIYGLQDELTPEVEDKDVTVRRADLKRDIRSLISYAVGCMFGRYSLTTSGLAYAGGEWDERKYCEDFMPDRDNILPICDDEYFADDIVSRFVRFVKVVFGKETLEENLRFIADALSGSGSPRDVIRSYFVNDFYADHLKIYQKRPIYWLFDSGKKNGFKALIYMHRYAPDTIARIRTDYVHEQQSRYRTALTDLTNRMASASTSERVKLSKQFTNITAQAEELRVYEEKIHHLADQMISIDLDDGVKHNYAIFEDVLASIK